ncbi:MAG: DUF3078 domain-containing protein [Alphaproteobacteria bacterium]|nr:DUF3078 domain-containing protein [Alphaproteobacteria bacterium]
MKVKFIILIIILGFIFKNNYVKAQDPIVDVLKSSSLRAIKVPDSFAKDTSKFMWRWGSINNFSLAQSTNSNWSAGGNNFSIAVSNYYNQYFSYKHKRQFWDNNLDFNLGFVQASDVGGRKNDDRIDILSKYGYKIDTTAKWYISGLFNFRTQLFDGRNYIGDSSVLTSSFLSPTYIIFSLGVDNKFFNNTLELFYSPLTNRTTYINKKTLRGVADFNTDSVTGIRNELGVFVILIYKNTFSNNLFYQGRIDLFSNYLKKPGNIQFYMTNYLQYNFKKNLGLTYSLDLIYDDNIKQFGANSNSPALQIRSQIGLSYIINAKKKVTE